jgi:hypothetical protein
MAKTRFGGQQATITTKMTMAAMVGGPHGIERLAQEGSKVSWRKIISEGTLLIERKSDSGKTVGCFKSPRAGAVGRAPENHA